MAIPLHKFECLARVLFTAVGLRQSYDTKYKFLMVLTMGFQIRRLAQNRNMKSWQWFG